MKRFLLEIDGAGEPTVQRMVDATAMQAGTDVPVDLIFGNGLADPAAVAARHANLVRWQAEFDQAHFSGPFKVWELSEQDMAYIASVQERYKLKLGKDIMRDGLFEGKHADLNAARNNGVYNLNNTDLSGYDSALKQEVERRLA
jgi:hypothetical protein